MKQEEKIEAGCQEFVPTLWQKIRWKICPRSPVDWPEMEGRFRDGVRTRAHVLLSFSDRIKVLLTGKLTVICIVAFNVNENGQIIESETVSGVATVGRHDDE